MTQATIIPGRHLDYPLGARGGGGGVRYSQRNEPAHPCFLLPADPVVVRMHYLESVGAEGQPPGSLRGGEIWGGCHSAGLQ
jgi:hypothetical protein